MSSHVAIDLLERRFLRPDRRRLPGLRALARSCDTVQAFVAALSDEGHPSWMPGARWFRMTANEAARLEVHRRWRTRDLPLGHPGRPTRYLPGSVAMAVWFACDPDGVVDAELAARRFVAHLGVVTESRATPPSEVVWRVTSAASTRGQLAPFLKRTLPRQLGTEGEWGAIDRRWSTWFSRVATWTMALGHWRVRHGNLAEAPIDPFTAWVRLWETGAGLWDVHDVHIELFLPEVDPAPVWSHHELRGDRHDVDQQLHVELLDACLRSTAAHVRRLLREGADPNALVVHLGSRPLHRLAERPVDEAWPAIGRALLEAGADPTLLDGRGRDVWTRAAVLHTALQQLQGLARLGVPVDLRDARGRTALHRVAARHEVRPAVEVLLDLGFSVDALDADESTPLHVALAHEVWDVAEVLLDHGADPGRHTLSGHSMHDVLGALAPPAELVERLGPTGPRRCPSSRSAIVVVPEALAEAFLDDVPDTLMVLADWLAEHDDPRAEPVRLAVLYGQRRASRRAYREAVDAARDAMLQPFVEASPLGLRFVRDAESSFGIEDGILSQLHVEHLYARQLAALVDHPGAQLLRRLTVVARHPSDIVWPEASAVRTLHWQVIGLLPEVVVPTDRLGRLARLEVRTTARVVVRVAHPTLRSLRIEQPWDDAGPAVPPELEVPAIERFEWVTSRVVEPGRSAWDWWQTWLEQPPPSLTALELRPTSVVLLASLTESALWEQLCEVQLSSVRGDLVEWLEAGRRTRVHDFVHLSRVSFTTVAAPVAERIRRWVDANADVLPPVEVRNVGVRPRGRFS